MAAGVTNSGSNTPKQKPGPRKPQVKPPRNGSAVNAARRREGAANAGANRRQQRRDVGAIANRSNELSKSPNVIARGVGNAGSAAALRGLIAIGDRVERAGVSRQDQEKIRNTSRNLKELAANMNAAAAAREPKKPQAAARADAKKPGEKGRTDRSAAARKGWEKRRAGGKGTA